GRCDVPPKGDPAGFVRVLDETHLVVHDRPGNKRLDGMRNILANPHVGLLFLVPGRGETLRVNGRACITRDADLLATLAVADKIPSLAIGVEVEEVFIHCAKAFKRSGLWEPARWPDVSGLTPTAKMFHDQVAIAGMSVEDFARRLETGYRTGLYKRDVADRDRRRWHLHRPRRRGRDRACGHRQVRVHPAGPVGRSH